MAVQNTSCPAPVSNTSPILVKIRETLSNTVITKSELTNVDVIPSQETEILFNAASIPLKNVSACASVAP